jgi:hypothetical protein
VSLTLTAFMTNGGAPYNSFTPTIDIWNAASGAQVVTAAAMTQIGTSAIYKYPFSAALFGVNYVFRITGDSGIPASERYQWGSVMQDTTDRIIGQVVADGGSSATQFKTDRTEATTGYWVNTLCMMMTGSLAGQVQKVSGYDGTTKIVTLTAAFTGTPSAGDTYQLISY